MRYNDPLLVPFQTLHIVVTLLVTEHAPELQGWFNSGRPEKNLSTKCEMFLKERFWKASWIVVDGELEVQCGILFVESYMIRGETP
jgi:hypothetical protein